MNVSMPFDKFMELLPKLFSIVERVAKESCCLCKDECLACDAQDLIKEMERK